MKPIQLILWSVSGPDPLLLLLYRGYHICSITILSMLAYPTSPSSNRSHHHFALSKTHGISTSAHLTLIYHANIPNINSSSFLPCLSLLSPALAPSHHHPSSPPYPHKACTVHSPPRQTSTIRSRPDLPRRLRRFEYRV